MEGGSCPAATQRLKWPTMFNQPFFFPAVAIGLLSIPLALALIPRNRFYGVRTARTLASDRDWYATNRLAGWLCLLASGAYLGLAATWPMNGPRDPRFTWWLLHLAFFAGPLIGSLTWTLWHARKRA